MKLGARHPEVKTVNPNDRMEGKGIQIGGSVGLAQDGVLRAEVKGDVRSSCKLVISKGSVVSGVVQARDIRLEGEVEGGVEGSGQVWLVAGSRLRSRCVAASLRIEPGADFSGEIRVGE
jgi:cytoskeletal protein CcmA (bactofilin family)